MDSRRESGLRQRELETFLARIRAETGIPGIGLALSVAERRTFASSGTLTAEGAAPLTEDARFHLGCIVKVLLALATLELARRAALDLNAPIATYLHELRGTLHGRTVLVRHLVSHTSGYQGTNPLEPEARELTWARFVAYLRHAPQLFAPGTVFSYEHTEAVLLESVLERATGRPMLELIQTLVLAPLGIAEPVLDTRCDDRLRVGHHARDEESKRFVGMQLERIAPFWRAAFSSYTLSLRELLRLAEGLTGAGTHATERVLAEPTLRMLRQQAVALPPSIGGPVRELMPVAFGHGTAHLRGGWLGNTGVTRGQCIGLRYDPGRRIAVVVGLNAMVPHLRDIVLNAVCASLAAPVDRGASASPPEIELRTLGGVYRGGGRSRVVAKLEDERLVCEIGSIGAPPALRVEIVQDGNGLHLDTPVPQLSIAFFREPATSALGLMLGLNAYKRIGVRNGMSAPDDGH